MNKLSVHNLYEEIVIRIPPNSTRIKVTECNLEDSTYVECRYSLVISYFKLVAKIYLATSNVV